MPIIPSSSGMHRAQYVPFNAAKVVKGIPLANIRNEKQNPFRCGMSSVSGAYHRDALGFAMSKSQDVMANASDLSAREQECIQRTLGWLNSGGGIGNIVLQRIAALGASHAAVVELVKDAPGDSDLRALERQVTKMIVDLGIAIGGCRTPPQGAALHTLEKAVAKLNDKADLCVKSCSSIIGGQRLMEAIGRAILPQPIMNALVDKRPDLVEKISKDGAGAIDLTELLNAQAMRTVERVVNVELDVADPQAAVTAVIQLLKIPEFVVERDPGKEGAQPNKEKGVSDLPPGLREFAGDGKNVAVNYNDFGKMGNKSTVDGANAAQLAALDLEKHRSTIDGMLKAFKLGLEGSRGCGHLITGIHNPSGNVSTFTHDPRQAKNTGNIEIQTDPIEDGPQRENIVNREIHQGSGNVLDGDDQLLGTPQSHQDNANADPDASTYTIAEKDPIVWGDESLGNTNSADRAIRVDSSDDNVRSPDSADPHVEQSVVGDGGDRWVDLLEERLQALKSNNSDLENVPERIENEGIDEKTPERVSQFDNVPEIFRIKASYVRSAPPESIRDESVGRDRVPRMDFVQDDNDVAKQGFTARVRFFEDAARRAGKSGAGVTGTLGFVPPPTVNPKGSVISPEREFKLYVDARNEENSDRLMLYAGSEGKVEDFSRWRGKSKEAGRAVGSVLVQDMKAFFKDESLDASAKLIQPSITRGLGLAHAAPVVAGGSAPKPIPGRQGSPADGARTINSIQKFMSLRKEGASVSDALSKSGAGKAVGGMAQAKSQAARIERLMQTEMPASVNPAVISQEELSRSPLHIPEIDSLPDQALADTGVDLQARLDGRRLSSPTLDRQSSSVEQDQASSPKGPIGAMTANLLSDFRNVKLKTVPKIWRDSLGQGWRDMKGAR